MNKQKSKIIFLNQMAGPMFRELAEDVSKEWAPSTLFTGHPDTVKFSSNSNNTTLVIQKSPEYNRKSNLSRLVSWMRYFIAAFNVVRREQKESLIFIVSNPPFLGLLGLFFKIVRNQKYVILVYDIYPDLLVSLGKIRNGFVASMWNCFNRVVYQNSTIVFTIGQDMADRLNSKFDVKRTCAGKVISIPCWADLDIIKPIPKDKNWFAGKYGHPGKTTVLYSGNMGNTHDIESILEVAKELSGVPGIHFLFIGEGAKWVLVENTIKENNLQNITLLPFQPEDILPYSLTTGDIGIVAYQPGTEGCMVPSKTYYYMAAGLAILVTSSKKNTLSETVDQFDCGISVRSGDISGMANAILDVHNNPTLLDSYKKIARCAAETLYSRKNTEEFERAIKSVA